MDLRTNNIFRYIVKTVINLILKITWFNNIGIRIRHRMKWTDYDFNRVGWTINIYSSTAYPIKKRWKK